MIQSALTSTFQNTESANAVLAMLPSDEPRPDRSAHHQRPLDSIASIALTNADRISAVEADRVRVNVLECAAALDQLHATLTEELGQRPQL
jgi:hypothetical protein